MIDDIIKKFIEHINKNGGIPSEWYTGIAADPDDRVSAHNALDNHPVCADAGSEHNAREIERRMIECVGTQGGGSGGDQNSRWVYCYKTSLATVETA